MSTEASAQIADDAQPQALLRVDSLTVAFSTSRGVIYPARQISFRVGDHETLGLVGESGSGKSVTLRASWG